MRIIAYMDYDKVEDVYLETVYFDRPTTRHTNPNVVTRKVIIISEEKYCECKKFKGFRIPIAGLVICNGCDKQVKP